MDFIRITKENLETEHICCAISGAEAQSKKEWLKNRLEEGLVFLKGDARGKCFIEFIPAEQAWAPVRADGYMYIDCFWVSGRFKGHGYSNFLLEQCIQISKAEGKKGLVTLSSDKKRGFLADPKYLEYKGFQACDTAKPYFKLMAMPFENGEDKPAFREQVKHPVPGAKGFTLYYTDQCPFTAKYVPILAKMAKEREAAFEAVHLTSTEQAQNSFSPFSTFSLYYDGEFLTHEILSEKKFEKILVEQSLTGGACK